MARAPRHSFGPPGASRPLWLGVTTAVAEPDGAFLLQTQHADDGRVPALDPDERRRLDEEAALLRAVLSWVEGQTAGELDDVLRADARSRLRVVSLEQLRAIGRQRRGQ